MEGHWDGQLTNTHVLTLPIGAGLMTHMWDVELVLWRTHVSCTSYLTFQLRRTGAVARLDFRDPLVCGPLGERIWIQGYFRVRAVDARTEE